MLGLYIHIPFCVSKCKYCDFNSYKINKISKEIYIEDLKKEMEMYKKELEKNNIGKISSIFLGGGTPSILSSEELSDIFKHIKLNFEIEENAEVTMECNPGTLTKEKLNVMKKIGINRLSIGLQAVQNSILNSIGRIHTYEDFWENYRHAIEVGFDNINIDLMYCLPNQTIDDWKETLENIVKLEPSHISAYSLILEEGTELYNMYERNEFEITDEETDIELYNYTIEYLKDNGYNQYEISNYSKEGKECRHNILYWKCKPYIGLGAGASGYINKIRYTNVESLQDYHNKIEKNKKPISSQENLDIEDLIEEKVFMGLRMNEGIKYKDFKDEFNIDFKERYKNQIESLVQNKLLEECENGIKLTQRGREISNTVFVEFIN